MASIKTFFGTSGGGSISGSGTATRVAFWDGTTGSPSTTLGDSSNLEWYDSTNILAVGGPNTVQSTLTIAGATASDSTSALEVRTNLTYGDKLLFRVYDNGRIDSRMLSSTEALTTNVAIGLNAGRDITTGDGNTGVGTAAIIRTTSGSNNSAFGAGSLQFNTTGASNSAFGSATMGANNDGSDNSAFGFGSLAQNTSGNLNSSFGVVSMGANTTGGNNSAFGAYSLYVNTTGTDNTSIGYNSLSAINPGTGNTAVGSFAGTYIGSGFSLNTSCNNSVYIGFESRASSTGSSNEIVIGNNAVGGGSNTVTIGNLSISDTFIRGNVNLTEGGNVVIGTGTGTKIGTSSNQKIAFYGDTPDVQPTTSITGATFVTGGGGVNIKTGDTFGGYTIGQIAAALIRLGLLA